jgi:hypothetical protein
VRLLEAEKNKPDAETSLISIRPRFSMTTGVGFRFCHPEPGPELDSGSIDFGISAFGFKNLGFKAPPCGRGLLLLKDLEAS